MASTTVTLPADAANAGQPVTVEATLNNAGFDIVNVTDDNTLAIEPGVVTTATVTYVKTAGGTGRLSVSIPFSGSFNFEIRNMITNLPTLCGSCHTQGAYKFTVWGRKQDRTFINVSTTHNVDVLPQWRASGHADFTDTPFEEFSSRPFGGSHVTTYPFDMSIPGTGGVGSLRNGGNTTFTLTQTPDATKAYLSAPGNTSLPVLGNNNYACFQCHNGIGAIDYLKDRQGTPEASVLWGDTLVTCYTCHDPHNEGAGDLIRIPVKLSYNSRFVSSSNPRGGINKFMDGTDIPSNVEKGIICLFCHQGRESGLTAFIAMTAAGGDPYGRPNDLISANGFSFVNPHYFQTGALLWSKNAWEFAGKEYSTGVPAHQEINCMGCHMSLPAIDETAGGHTFKPTVETCKRCHGESINSFQDIPALGDYDGDGVVETAFAEFGTLSDNGTSGSGLLFELRSALTTKGIFYDPSSYPYFFTSDDPSTRKTFSAFTPNTLAAAFNLGFMFKTGPSENNCIGYHNAYYGAQILQDSIIALLPDAKSALDALGVNPAKFFRGPTNRPATDYRTIVVNP